MEQYLIKRFNDDATTATIAVEVSQQFKLKITRSSVCSKIRRLRKFGIITRPAQSPIKRMTMTPEQRRERKNAYMRQWNAEHKQERQAKPKKHRSELKSHRYLEIDPPASIAWEPVEGSLHVSLFALQRGQCAYPLSDGTYCGCKSVSGSQSWCDAHYKRCWRKKTVTGNDKTMWR
jgi:hypothetical protein